MEYLKGYAAYHAQELDSTSVCEDFFPVKLTHLAYFTVVERNSVPEVQGSNLLKLILWQEDAIQQL